MVACDTKMSFRLILSICGGVWFSEGQDISPRTDFQNNTHTVREFYIQLALKINSSEIVFAILNTSLISRVRYYLFKLA